MLNRNQQFSYHSDDDELIFLDESPEEFSDSILPPWKLMIVDDEESIHLLTRTILEDFSFEGRQFTYLDAYSGQEAIDLIREHPDTTLILLDVVMENEHAGLDVVRTIRDKLQNAFVRIILYTGQPGQAPEGKVVREYDINDYKEKASLTAQGLYTAAISALRSYRDLELIEQQRIELKQTMAEAQAAQKARYQFLANMGHELRTPLNHIIGFADILLRAPMVQKHLRYLESIKKAGDGLNKVLNNILELTELTEGRIVLDTTGFSLRRIIGDLMGIMEIQAQWKELSVSYQIADNVPDRLIGDPHRLKQVITNLIANSIKYTREGTIELQISRADSQPNHLLFMIRDTGIGISREHLDQIFQPFGLGEDVMRKQYSGAGLGLAISKDVIEKMNGKIWVDTKEQQGSTFYFTLEFKMV